jgi:DNA repair protein RadC
MKKGEGHRQRLRDKLQEGGLERFSDEEVIEFLLTLWTPRKDVKSPAREALKKFAHFQRCSPRRFMSE